VNVPEIRLLELRNTYKWGGGPDKTILLSAERHDPSRVNVVVAYIRDIRDCEFEVAKKARAKGLTFYEITERGKFDPSVLRTIRDIVTRHDINLIHSHDYKSDLFAYLVRKWLWRRRIALISTAHAWVILGPRGEFYRKLDLKLMKRFDHLIAVSHATKVEMVDAGVPEDIITVIHNGIDTEAWAPARANGNIRQELKLSPPTPVVGYVGRISPEKDLETWLRAAALVADSIPAARFVLVGDGRDGNTRDRLERLAVSLGIGDRVFFAGYRHNLLPAYAAFDIFLLSSRREGLPNSLLEAMAMSVPVVTTDVAGAKELVMDGRTGFVVPQGDVEGIARAVTILADDDCMRKQMGQASRDRIEQEFSFSRRIERIEDLYEQITCNADAYHWRAASEEPQ
jgi:glycosyltransferase involved in cell wall biosynthesis